MYDNDNIVSIDHYQNKILTIIGGLFVTVMHYSIILIYRTIRTYHVRMGFNLVILKSALITVFNQSSIAQLDQNRNLISI